jgi:hypothetical protein
VNHPSLGDPLTSDFNLISPPNYSPAVADLVCIISLANLVSYSTPVSLVKTCIVGLLVVFARDTTNLFRMVTEKKKYCFHLMMESFTRFG